MTATSASGDALGAASQLGDEPEDGDPVSAADAERDGSPDESNVEEVIVTGERDDDLTVEQRQAIYEQLARGRQLYSQSEYKRAFPLLLNTAQHGFKDAQARVGYIYQHGLGEVTRDSTEALGWLGVAASGTSSPGIENYFNDLWDRIPERFVPYFEEVVEEYESTYGEKATGVTCELRRPMGSHVKRLSCFFEDDLTLEERELYEDMLAEVINGNTNLQQREAASLPLPVVAGTAEADDDN